ncbi:hypothetical protein [Methanohalophilus profundi]|uniref:hypothetical protein n=1 Tax=Methanohalophilus profundi TaxID=2138083 RepID=UPI00101DDE19|nr:hypothetical protein [Methanohalophilus profundi]
MSQDNFIVIIVYLAVSAIFAAIISIPYMRIFKPLSDAINNDSFALSVSISSLLIAFALALAGFLFDNRPLVLGSLSLSFVQIPLLAVFGHFKIPVDQNADSKTGSSI